MQSPAAPNHHYHHGRHKYQRAADQPRLSYGALGAAPPSPLVAAPIRPPSIARVRICFRRCFARAAFLMANAALATCVGLLSLALLGCVIVLLPLCGVGVLAFRLIFRLGIVANLAKVDVTLANTVLPPENQMRLELALPSARDALLLRSPPPLHPLLREDRALDRVISSLNVVTPASAAALVYFATLKWMLALPGLGLVGILLWTPLSLLRGAFGSTDHASWLWDGVVPALLFVVASSSLSLATHICCSCTRLFCCERDRQPTPSPLAVSHTKVLVVRVANGW